MVACLSASLVLMVPGCDLHAKKPIPIGFVGGMTGRTANLGISGRDGALLAVEQINERGGIDGHRVELVVRDDKQDDAVGQQVVRELIARKLPVIIGPMTSSMAVVMAPEINSSNCLLLSPTVSTTLLGGQDDNFFRVYPECLAMGHSLADYAYNEKSLRRFAVIYDLGNRAFTESWKNCFSDRFKTLGGEIIAAVSFTSGGNHQFMSLMRQALKKDPDGILILANSLDTALLAQQMMKIGKRVPLFTSEWSMTRDLLRSGGQSVEGITLFHTFNEASRKQKYLDFKQSYQKRFGHPPSFSAIHAYDATQVVLAGLAQGVRTGPEMKAFLLDHPPFDSLQGTISFNPYGDVNRDLFLTVVADGEFTVTREIPVKTGGE